MTSAPARRASVVVASLLPLSTTMTRSTTARGMLRMTCSIDSCSLSVGITTRTLARGPSAPCMLSRSIGKLLQTPAHAAACARGRRLIGQQRLTEGDIGVAVPDVAQRHLGRVAERVILVAALREWRDAAGQSAPIGGEIHDRPGPPAERPG